MRCFVDAWNHYSPQGIESCDLRTLGLKLHPVHRVKIKWALQKQADNDSFRDVPSREVELKSDLPDDWSRGNWSCCDSSFKFGSATVDAKEPDILGFTETDGALYFGQPHSPFITAVDADFDALQAVPKNLSFERRAPVHEGKTYILTTNPPLADPSVWFYVKMKVLAIQPGSS